MDFQGMPTLFDCVTLTVCLCDLDLTTFDFNLDDLSKGYIITLNKISPRDSFRSIDYFNYFSSMCLFWRCFCCISISIITRASFYGNFTFNECIVSFTFAKVGIRGSSLQSLTNLRSLLILNHFPFSRSNVL